MIRKVFALILAVCTALSCAAVAAAAGTSDNAYSAAVEALSSTGMRSGDAVAMDTGILQPPAASADAAALPMTQLPAAVQQEQRQAQQQTWDDSVTAAVSQAALLIRYDGVLITAEEGASLFETAEDDADVVRTIPWGKVARLLDAEGERYLVSFGTSEGYVNAAACQGVRYEDYEGTSAVSTLVEDLILHAYTYLGVPYSYGGSGYGGVDCSGFTMAVFAAFGYSLPHGASDQYYVSRHVSDAERSAGDLVFFDTFGGISHVGLYLGNGWFIHANSSGGVHIESLYDSYWSRCYLFAGRVIG